MLLTLNIYDLDKTNILIGNKELNIIGDYNFFYKLFYSTSYYIMNSICIKMNIDNYKQNIYYNYIKISYNINNNFNLINGIGLLEKSILSNMTTYKKYNLYNDLLRGSIKIQKKNNIFTSNIVLRITGIWENNNNCGLTYKFIFI